MLRTVLSGEASKVGATYLDALASAAQLVLAAEDIDATRAREVRLRLAMHLAPAAALAYDRTNPISRHTLVLSYMTSLGLPETTSVDLASDVARILDAWDVRRRDVRSGLAHLLRSQGELCACCRLKFDTVSVAVVTQDNFKPYYLDVEDYTRPEVDHIEAVSHLGTNDPRNLQVLCRLCNQGKGAGLGLQVLREMSFAGLSIDTIPVQHRASMLYYVLTRDGGMCRDCGMSTRELTIRPQRLTGGFVRSNLSSVCYECANVSAEKE